MATIIPEREEDAAAAALRHAGEAAADHPDRWDPLFPDLDFLDPRLFAALLEVRAEALPIGDRLEEAREVEPDDLFPPLERPVPSGDIALTRLFDTPGDGPLEDISGKGSEPLFAMQAA